MVSEHPFIFLKDLFVDWVDCWRKTYKIAFRCC